MSQAVVGLPFALAAFLITMASAALQVASARQLAVRFAVALAVAWTLTLAVDAVGQVLASALREMSLALRWLDAGAAVQGAVALLYVVGLGGLHVTVRALERALARRRCKVRRCVRDGRGARRVIAGEILVRGAW